MHSSAYHLALAFTVHLLIHTHNVEKNWYGHAYEETSLLRENMNKIKVRNKKTDLMFILILYYRI